VFCFVFKSANDRAGAENLISGASPSELWWRSFILFYL